MKAFGSTFLGRPRSQAAIAARETDRFSRFAMLAFALLCLLAGILPGFVLDVLAGVSELTVGARLDAQSAQPWLRIAPISPERGVYNGLLVFAMIAIAAAATAAILRRVASHALRRAPAWDCGFPDSSPATQYTSGSFAQPILRVFGSVVFRAREHVEMPKPGGAGAAKLTVEMHDTVWEVFYAPVIRLVDVLADRLTKLQFLTIRKYLMLVFATLILMLIIIGVLR